MKKKWRKKQHRLNGAISTRLAKGVAGGNNFRITRISSIDS